MNVQRVSILIDSRLDTRLDTLKHYTIHDIQIQMSKIHYIQFFIEKTCYKVDLL